MPTSTRLSLDYLKVSCSIYPIYLTTEAFFMQSIWGDYSLEHTLGTSGLQTFSLKDQIVNILGSVGQIVCCNYLIVPFWLESSHRQHGNGWVWLCSNKTLFMETGIWI